MDEKSYIKKYRDYLSQQNIPHKNFTDDQILYQYGKEAEAGGHLDKMPNLARMYRQSNARIQRERDGLMHYPNQLVEGLKKGGNIAGGTIFGGIGLIGDTVGITTPGSDSLAEEFMRDAGRAKTTVKSLKDAETFADYADFFVAGVGEVVPTMLTIAGTGGATGLLAGAGLKVAPQVMQKKIVGRAISKEIKKRGPSKSSASLIVDKNKAFAELGKEGQEIARRYAQAWGNYGGSAAASGTMGMGEVYTSLLPYTRLPETHEDYIPLEDAQAYSFAFGSAIGALDSIVPSILGGQVLRRFFPGKRNISAIDAARADNFVKKSLFKAMGAGMVLEGGTEATQEWLSIAADKFAHARQDDSTGFGEDLAGAFSDPDFYRLLDAGVLGAIGGGVAGGAFTLAGNAGVPKRQAQKQAEDDAVQAARLRNAGIIEDAQKNLEDRARAIYDRKALEEGDEVFLITGQEATYLRPLGDGRGLFVYEDADGNTQEVPSLLSPPFVTPKLSASKSVVDAIGKNTRRQAVQKAGEELLNPKQPSDPSVVDKFKEDAGVEKQEQEKKESESKVNQAEITRNKKNDQGITNGDQAAYDALEKTIYDAGITSDVLISEQFTLALKRAIENDAYTGWVESNYDTRKEGTPSKEDMLNAFRRAHKVIHKDGRQTSADQQAEEAKKAAEEAEEESVRKQQEVERKAQEDDLNDRKADIQAKSYQKEDGGKVRFLAGGFKKELASNPNIGDLADAEWKIVSANLENGTIDVEANGVTITADPRNFGKKKLPKQQKKSKKEDFTIDDIDNLKSLISEDSVDQPIGLYGLNLNWQEKLFESKKSQLLELIKKGITSVEDVKYLNNILNDMRGALTTGIDLNADTGTDYVDVIAKTIQGFADSVNIDQSLINEYKSTETKKAKELRNWDLQRDKDGAPSFDGRTIEYFWDRQTNEPKEPELKPEPKEVEGYKKDESEIKQKGEAFDALPEVENGTYVIKFGNSKTIIEVTEDGWMFSRGSSVGTGENISRPKSLPDIILRATGRNLYDLSSIRFSDEYIINATFDGVTFNFTLSSPISVNMPDYEAGLNEQETNGKFRVLDGQWVFDGGKQKTDLLNEQQHLMLKSRFSLTDDPSATTVRYELLEAKTSAKNAKQRKDMPSIESAQIGSNESNGVIVLRHIPSGQIFLRTAVPTGAVKTGTEDVKITKLRKRNSDQPNALLTASDFNKYEQLPEVFEKIELILFSARPGSLRMRFDSLDQYENWVSGFKKFEVEAKLTVHQKVPALIKRYENDKVTRTHDLHFALEYDIEEKNTFFAEQDGKPVVSESIGIYLPPGRRPAWHYLKTSDILEGMSESDGQRIVNKIYEILDDPKRGKTELGHEGLMGAMQSLKFVNPKKTEEAPPRTIDVRTLVQYFSDKEQLVYDKTGAVINEANAERVARAFVSALFEQLKRESGAANRKGREDIIVRVDKDGKSENITEQAPDQSQTPAESVSESIALEEAMEVMQNEPDPIKLGRTVLFNEFNAEQLKTLHQIAISKVDFEMNKEELMEVLGLMDVTPEFVEKNRVEQGERGQLMDLPSMVANMDNPTQSGIIEVIAFVKHIGDKVDPQSIVEIIQQQNKAPSIKADEAFKLESDTYGKVNIAVRNEYEALVNKVLGSEAQLSDKQKELLSSAFSKILNAVRRPDETSGMMQDALEGIAKAFEENGMFAFKALEESGAKKISDFKDALINAKDAANAPAISQTTADIFIEFLKNVSTQVVPSNRRMHFTELLHDHLNRKVNKQGPLLLMQSEFRKLEESTGAIYDKTSAPNKDPISEMRDPYGSDSLPFTPDITEDSMTHMENVSKGQKSNTSQSKPISEQQKLRNAQAMEEVFPANMPGIDLSGVALDNIGKIISNQALPDSMDFATQLHRVLTQMMNARQDAGLPVINFDRTTTLSSEPGQITRGLFSPRMQTVFIDPDFFLGEADPIGEPLPITGNKEKDILMLIGMHELWHGTMEDSLYTYEEQQRKGERSELSDVIDLIDDVINEVADQAKGTKFSGLFAQNVDKRRREILNRIWNRRDLAEWLSTKGVSSDLQKRIDENGEGFIDSLLDALYGAYLKLLKILGINTDGTALKALLDLNRRLDKHYRELQPQETTIVDMAAMAENHAPVLYSKLEKVMAEATAPQVIEIDNTESLRQELNKLQKEEIPALMKAGKREEAQPLIARQKEIKQLIKDQAPKKPKTPQAPKKASGKKWINFFKKTGVSNAELNATIGPLLDTEKEFLADDIKRLVEQSSQVTLIETKVTDHFGSYVPTNTWPGELVDYKEIIVFAPQLDPVSEDNVFNIVEEEMGDGEGRLMGSYFAGNYEGAQGETIEIVKFDGDITIRNDKASAAWSPGIILRLYKSKDTGEIFMQMYNEQAAEAEAVGFEYDGYYQILYPKDTEGVRHGIKRPVASPNLLPVAWMGEFELYSDIFSILENLDGRTGGQLSTTAGGYTAAKQYLYNQVTDKLGRNYIPSYSPNQVGYISFDLRSNLDARKFNAQYITLFAKEGEFFNEENHGELVLEYLKTHREALRRAKEIHESEDSKLQASAWSQGTKPSITEREMDDLYSDYFKNRRGRRPNDTQIANWASSTLEEKRKYWEEMGYSWQGEGMSKELKDAVLANLDMHFNSTSFIDELSATDLDGMPDIVLPADVDFSGKKEKLLQDIVDTVTLADEDDMVIDGKAVWAYTELVFEAALRDISRNGKMSRLMRMYYFGMGYIGTSNPVQNHGEGTSFIREFYAPVKKYASELNNAITAKSLSPTAPRITREKGARILRKIKAWTQRFGEVKVSLKAEDNDSSMYPLQERKTRARISLLKRFFDIEIEGPDETFINPRTIITIKPPTNDQLFETEFRPDPNALFYRGLDKRITGGMSYHWSEMQLGGYGKEQKGWHHLRYGIYRGLDGVLEGRILESQSDVENMVQADAYAPFDKATYSSNYLEKMYHPEFITHHRYSRRKIYQKGSIAIDDKAIFVALRDDPQLSPAESFVPGSNAPYTEWKPIGKRKTGAVVGYEAAKASDLKNIYYVKTLGGNYSAVHVHKEIIDFYSKEYRRISKGDQILKGSLNENNVNLYDENISYIPPEQLTREETYVVEVEVSEDKEIEVFIDDVKTSQKIAEHLLGYAPIMQEPEATNYILSNGLANSEESIGAMERRIVNFYLRTPAEFERSLLQENNELVAMKYFLREMAKQGITKTKVIRGDVIFPVVYHGSDVFSENVLGGDIKSVGIQAAYVRTAQKWAKLTGQELKKEGVVAAQKFDMYDTFKSLQKLVNYYRTDRPESYTQPEIENFSKLYDSIFFLKIDNNAYYQGLENHFNNQFITEVILDQDGFGDGAKFDKLVLADSRNPFAFQEYAGEDHIFVRGTRSKMIDDDGSLRELNQDTYPILNALEKVLSNEGVEDFSYGEIDELMEAISPFKRVKLIEGQKEGFLKKARDILYRKNLMTDMTRIMYEDDDVMESYTASTHRILDYLGLPYPDEYINISTKPLADYRKAILERFLLPVFDNVTPAGYDYISFDKDLIANNRNIFGVHAGFELAEYINIFGVMADEYFTNTVVELGTYASEEDAQNALDKHYAQFKKDSVYIKSTVPFIADTGQKGEGYSNEYTEVTDEFLLISDENKDKKLFRVFLLDLNNIAINTGHQKKLQATYVYDDATVTVPEEDEYRYYDEDGLSPSQYGGHIEVSNLTPSPGHIDLAHSDKKIAILRIKDANDPESDYGIIDGQAYQDSMHSAEGIRVNVPVGAGRNNQLPAGFNKIRKEMQKLRTLLLNRGRLQPDMLSELGEFYTVDIPAERLNKNLYEGEPMLMQDGIDRSQVDTRTHLKITRVGDDEFKVEGLAKDGVFTARQLREGLVRFKEMPSRVGILELGENGKPLEREGSHLFREGDIKTWVPSTLLEAYDRNDASEMTDQLDLNFEGKVDNSLNFIVLEPNSTDLKKNQVLPRHIAKLYTGSGAMFQRYDKYLEEQNMDTDETPEILYTEDKTPYQSNEELIKLIVRSGFPWGADGTKDYIELRNKVHAKNKLPKSRILREINAIKRIFDNTPDGEKDYFQYKLWHHGQKVYPKWMMKNSDFMSDPTNAPQGSLPSEIKPDDNVEANMKIVSASVNEASVPVAYAAQDIRQLLGKPDMSVDEIWNRYLKGQSPTKEIQKLVKRYGAEMEFQTADLHKNNPNMRDETKSQTLKRLEKQIGHIHKQIANISLEFDTSRRGSIASKIAEYEDRTILDEGHLFDRARYGDRIRDRIDVLISNTEQALIEETGEEKTDPLLNAYRAITGNELTDKAFRDALIQTASTSSGGGVSASKISDLILQLSKIKEVEKLNAKAIYELVKTEFNNEGRAIIVSAVLAKEARNFIELAKLSQSRDMGGRRDLLAKLRDLSRATLGELKVLNSADAKSYFPLGNTVERGIQKKFVEDRIALLEAQEQRARKVIDQEIYQRLLEEYNLDSQKMQMLLGHNPAKQLNDGDKFPVMTKIEDGYTMSEITVRMSNFMQFDNFDEIKAALRLNKKYLDDPEVTEDNDYRYVKQMQMNAEVMPIWQAHYETGGMFQMHSLKSARERFQEMGPLGREVAQMINQFEIGYKANAPRARAMSRNWNVAFDDARKAFGFKEGHKFMDQVIGPVIKWNEDQPQLSGQREEFLKGAWEHAQKLVNKDDLSEGAEDALIKLLDAYKDKSRFHRELAQQYGLKVLDETIKMRDPMGRPFDRVKDSMTKEEVQYGTHLQRNPIDRGELTVPRSLRPEVIQAIINQMPQLGWSMEGSDASHTGEFNWSDLKSIVESKEIDNDTKLERLDFASAELIDDYVWEKFMVPYIDNNTSPKAFLFTPVGEQAIPSQTIEDAYQEVKALGLAGNKAFDAWVQALYERVPHREDRADFAEFKHAALVKYKQKYRQLRRSVSDIGSKGLDASITLAGHLMDSRSQSADIPIDFLRYTTYDEVTSPALVAKTMENAFFGRNAEILVSKMKQLVDETNAKHTALKDLASIINNPRSEGRIKVKGRYKDKAYSELENNRIFENVPGETGKEKLQNLLNAQSQMNSLLGGQLGGPGAVGHLEAYLLGDLGPFQDEKLAYELLGLNAYFVLNQPKSGVTNLMSIWDFDARYGGAVGKDNISDMLFGSWAAAGELIGGLLANFGIDPKTQSEEAEVLMPIFFNSYENDVGFKKNFLNVGAKAVKKNNFLGKDFRYDILRRGKTILDYDSRRGAKVKNQEGDRKYAPIGLRTMFLKPFSYFGSLANHSIAVANARKVSKLVHQIATYIEDYNAIQEKNGKPLLPQDYQVTSDELGKRLSDKTAFDILDLDLGHYGLGSLSNLARDYMERRSKGDKRILTKEQIIVSGLIGVNEVALEGGFSTTPAFLNSPYMRWTAPLQKWALNKVKQMNKSFRDLKNGEMDAKAALLMISTIVGLKIPLGLAYTFFWSDWYDEELLGKASPLRPLPKSAMLPLIGPFIEGDPANNLKAMLERVARAGNVGGMALDFVNATYNEFDTYSYNRGFSLDNRILIMSQLLNIRQAMGNMIGMGEIDYANVVRPMLYSMGFNGPIQQYNLFANALGLESEERRISNQIGNRHKLRAGIHTLGIEGRPMVGGTIKKTKFSAAVRRMERSAEADDAKGFNEAYKEAIEASIDRGDEDPEDAVIKAFKRRNLRTGISRYKLSDEEWEGVLGLYDEEASEPLREAMRMHEKYVDILDASKPKKGFVLPDITIKPVTYDELIRRSLSF